MEFSCDPFQTYSEESKKALLSDLKVICDNLYKSQPNAEKFYAGFYSKTVKNAPTYFKEFMPKAATLFSTKLATSLLQSIKNSQGSDQCKKSKTTNQSHLSERELAGLHYLGGYIFGNLYRTVRSSKEWKSSQSQQSFASSKSRKNGRSK